MSTLIQPKRQHFVRTVSLLALTRTRIALNTEPGAGQPHARYHWRDTKLTFKKEIEKNRSSHKDHPIQENY